MVVCVCVFISKHRCVGLRPCTSVCLTEHDPLSPSVVRARERPEPLLARRVPDGHLYPLPPRVYHLHLQKARVTGSRLVWNAAVGLFGWNFGY